LFSLAPALAQNPAESPSAPTLEETLKFIAGKVNAEGEVKFEAYWRKADGSRGYITFSDDLRGTTYEAETCRVAYVWRPKRNGKTFDDLERPFGLKDVNQIQVMSEVKSLNYDGTSEKTVVSTSQPITEVWLGLKFGQVRQFWFHDAKDAAAVAQAFGHAVELCGGRMQSSY
jgi:hypothetical protein